jgi:hypothetical protein
MNENDPAPSTIPTWYAFLTPVLEVMSDGRQSLSRSLKEAVCDRPEARQGAVTARDKTISRARRR